MWCSKIFPAQDTYYADLVFIKLRKKEVYLDHHEWVVSEVKEKDSFTTRPIRL